MAREVQRLISSSWAGNRVTRHPCLSLLTRNQATAATTLADQPDARHEPPGGLPFETIPGPKGLPVLGTLFEVLRNMNKSHLFVTRRFQDYGPIFREKAGPTTLVYLSDIQAIEKMCRLEGKYPVRIKVLPWNQWREERKLAEGILIGDGPDWKRMRKILDKRMLRPLHVKSYTDSFNDVVTDFVQRLVYIRETKGGGVSVPNMDMELFHWSLETIGTVLYETRFGGLSDDGSPEMRMFIKAVQGIFQTTGSLVYLPKQLAKLFTPKIFKLHEQSWQTVFDTSLRLIEAKTAELLKRVEAGEQVDGFLSHLLANQQLSRQELNANISEIMLGAVDTTSNTMQWVLYQLSQNPNVQGRLHSEVMEATSDGTRIPENKDLQKMPYLKAIIKEILRLYPVAGVMARVLQEDMVLCGYTVPKDTTVLASTYYTGRDPKNFPEPERFLPDRWLRGENESKHTFAWLPFGFGPRMCIGRRVAELEMQLLTARISQKFIVEPLNEKPLKPVTRGLIVPERSVEIKLLDRN